MTKQQEKAIETIRNGVFRHACYGSPDEYEYKRFEIREDAPLVFVISVVGKIGDEDTYASVFCRDHRHIVITPRGKMELLSSAKYDKKNKKMVPAKTRATGYKVLYSLSE